MNFNMPNVLFLRLLIRDARNFSELRLEVTLRWKKKLDKSLPRAVTYTEIQWVTSSDGR